VTSRLVDAFGSGELREGEGRQLVIEGRSIAVFRDGGCVRALDGICPHAGAPLGPGTIEEGHVVCPWHGFRFRLSDGASPDLAGVSQLAYRAVERDGRVLVEIPDEESVGEAAREAPHS